MKFLQTAIILTLAVGITACNKPTNTASNEEPSSVSKTSEPKNEAPVAVINPVTESKYVAYSASEFEALKGEQKFGVFFHADWCSTCVKWEERTTNALSQLPENTKILKADYDTETQLVKDLHVKKQSTLVMFDSNGAIVDAIGDPSVEEITNFFSTPDFNVIGEAGDAYVDFDQANFDTALGSEKMVVFFHADWCGTCRKWEKKLQASLNDLAPNTKILKANFDSNTDLRKKYEVVKQSTAVFINADGSVAKNESDPNIESLNKFFAS